MLTTGPPERSHTGFSPSAHRLLCLRPLWKQGAVPGRRFPRCCFLLAPLKAVLLKSKRLYTVESTHGKRMISMAFCSRRLPRRPPPAAGSLPPSAPGSSPSAFSGRFINGPLVSSLSCLLAALRPQLWPPGATRAPPMGDASSCRWSSRRTHLEAPLPCRPQRRQVACV